MKKYQRRHLFKIFVIEMTVACISSYAGAAPVTNPELRIAVQDAFSARLSKRSVPPPTAIGETIEVIKSGDESGWMLGAVTQVLAGDTSADPITKLFMARRVRGTWVVGLEGTNAFHALAATAPSNILSADERANLNSDRRRGRTEQRKAAPGYIGLALPWQRDTAWQWTGGAHGWSGESRPYSSLDFSGGDGRVLAPRDGYLYRSCEYGGSAIVKLVHDNGYTSTYYHMVQLPSLANGALVRQGDYLGRIGNGLPCGGLSTGAHVHFSLSQGGNEVPVNGKTIGGWQFFEGRSAYAGYAVRNRRQVSVYASLTNYGADDLGDPAPLPQAVRVPVRSTGSVNLRGAPSLSATVVGTVSNGDTVELICSAYGDSVQGNWGATRLWYRLNSGHWISDGFVYTATNDPIMPACV
ncbi:peptidoglycan DD-metalloendopeptidase family protein [Burkholderia pyrrocinia]